MQVRKSLSNSSDINTRRTLSSVGKNMCFTAFVLFYEFQNYFMVVRVLVNYMNAQLLFLLCIV